MTVLDPARPPWERFPARRKARPAAARCGVFLAAAGLEKHVEDSDATQKVVCFTETTARRAHFNPVWYPDVSTRCGRDWPIKAVDEFLDDAKERSKDGEDGFDLKALRAEPILKLTPFIEQMDPMRNGRRKEFWWEHEWRHWLVPHGVTF